MVLTGEQKMLRCSYFQKCLLRVYVKDLVYNQGLALQKVVNPDLDLMFSLPCQPQRLYTHCLYLLRGVSNVSL